jgi:ABC-type bacteriocin/lantibiotic exporter with double-glycine peptidase domain
MGNSQSTSQTASDPSKYNRLLSEEEINGALEESGDGKNLTSNDKNNETDLGSEVVTAINSVISSVEHNAKVESNSALLTKPISKEKQHASVNRLLKLLRPQWWIISVATLALALSTTCQLAQPLLFGRIIEVCSTSDPDNDRTHELNRYSVALLAILFIGGLAAIIRGWLYTLVGERLVKSVTKYSFCLKRSNVVDNSAEI